ncbi:MAG: JmjC domain-containing protein [Marinobacter adhaerens]
MDTAKTIPVADNDGGTPATDQTAQSSGTCRIWVENESEFSADNISLISHNFQHHPILQLDQLEALAHRLLPQKQCRFINPGAKQNSDFIHHAESPDGRDLSDVFRNISQPGSWVALYNAEADPKYAGLVREALSSVEHLVDRTQPGIFSPQAFIFISAPPSVTPFHIDRENNFWLQIHGRKIMNVWDSHDRNIIPASTVENFIVDKSLHDVNLRDEFMEARHEWDLGPGEGVYFPSTSPHSTRTETSWVTDQDAVSVSIGIVFYTEKTRKDAYVHSANRLLRKLGLTPKSPGDSRFEYAKFLLGRVLVAVKKRLRNYSPPTGFEKLPESY